MRIILFKHTFDIEYFDSNLGDSNTIKNLYFEYEFFFGKYARGFSCNVADYSTGYFLNPITPIRMVVEHFSKYVVKWVNRKE